MKIEHDSGEDVAEGILVFGTQAGLDDLENEEDWACDGAFKCSPHIISVTLITYVIGNKSIPGCFVLLPSKT